MPRKPATKSAKTRDPEEYKRFLEAARKAEASDDPKDFDRAFRKVVESKKEASKI